MIIMVADDEMIQMEHLKEAVSEAVPDGEITGFTDPLKALAWAKDNMPEIVFLDIQMPVMDGISLAKRLKSINPRVNLVFVTGYYKEYVFEAMPLHFSGYLQKPASAQKVRQELENLRFPLIREEPQHKLKVKCFGDFEIFYDDKPVSFSRVKSKEIFAYLVDRKGAKVNGNKICAVVYEDGENESSNKSNLRSCVADIKETLHALGADEVLVKGWDSYAIDPTRIDCDYFDWEKNEPYAIHAFHGEYMSQYSWAEETLGFLIGKQ
ncbi:MAG: response regulator [Clostridia bacterium]|nr:response regulator [Clostridia bacterium]